MPLPTAILFDLDDTLISAHLHPRETWKRAILSLDAWPESLDVDGSAAEIHRAARWFWSDPARHKEGRMDIRLARRRILHQAFEALGHPTDDPIVEPLGERFTALRTAETALFPDALDTLVGLRQRGVRLGLITNGNAREQRSKIDRFDLEGYFDHIQIEGEMGFGKPEEQAYAHALSRLGTSVDETWIVGDNLEWEVVVPQRLGFHAIWRDPVGHGLPEDATACPDRIVSRLIELLDG